LIRGLFITNLVGIIIFVRMFQASDWDKYAAEEYEMLVAEEGGNDAPEEM